MAGLLEVYYDEQRITLVYKDEEIEVKGSMLYHPISALDILRTELETKYQSIIAINGCRIDVDHRATGTLRCYFIERGKQATKLVDLFEPTIEIDKLCTLTKHLQAYEEWINSL